MTKESFHNDKGKHIKTEEYRYEGNLLKSKKEGMGLETTYEYDGDGRKIKETIGQFKTIHYSYDDFDRLIKKEQEGRQELYEYDWLDRVTAKTLMDAAGNVYAKESYHYDIHGNKDKTTIWQSIDKKSVDQSKYTPKNALRWKEDPLTNKTTWNYDDHYIDLLGLQVQERTIVDPLKRVIMF